jgi:hypothetical protein
MENRKLTITEYAIIEVNSALGNCDTIFTENETSTSWGIFDLNDPRVFGLVTMNYIKTDHKFWDGRKGNTTE